MTITTRTTVIPSGASRRRNCRAANEHCTSSHDLHFASLFLLLLNYTKSDDLRAKGGDDRRSRDAIQTSSRRRGTFPASAWRGRSAPREGPKRGLFSGDGSPHGLDLSRNTIEASHFLRYALIDSSHNDLASFNDRSALFIAAFNSCRFSMLNALSEIRFLS